MRKSLRLTKAGSRRPPDEPETRFTVENISRLREDIMSQRIPLNRTSISDDRITGLKALISKSGNVSFNVHYAVGDERPYMLVGHFPEPDEVDKDPESAQEAIDTARSRAHTIRELARQGIDVQEGLHRRLLREIDERGTKWRP